jgi:hypothetical protein
MASASHKKIYTYIVGKKDFEVSDTNLKPKRFTRWECKLIDCKWFYTKLFKKCMI